MIITIGAAKDNDMKIFEIITLTVTEYFYIVVVVLLLK